MRAAAELALIRRIANKAQDEARRLEEEVALTKSRNKRNQTQRSVESAAMRLRVARSPGCSSFGGSPSKSETALMRSLGPRKLSYESSAASSGHLDHSWLESSTHVAGGLLPEALLASAIGFASQDEHNASYRTLKSAPIHLHRQEQHRPKEMQQQHQQSATASMYHSPETSHMHRRVLGVAGVRAGTPEARVTAGTGSKGRRNSTPNRMAQPSPDETHSTRTNWGWGGVGRGGYGHESA